MGALAARVTEPAVFHNPSDLGSGEAHVLQQIIGPLEEFTAGAAQGDPTSGVCEQGNEVSGQPLHSDAARMGIAADEGDALYGMA